MAMKMLAAGGMPVLTDGVRTADESNPKGYYELEAVKELHKQSDTSWLEDARGKAVKVVSFLLTWLPETYDYKVIFMQRDVREVIASETTMLLQRGQPQVQAFDGQPQAGEVLAEGDAFAGLGTGSKTMQIQEPGTGHPGMIRQDPPISPGAAGGGGDPLGGPHQNVGGAKRSQVPSDTTRGWPLVTTMALWSSMA